MLVWVTIHLSFVSFFPSLAISGANKFKVGVAIVLANGKTRSKEDKDSFTRGLRKFLKIRGLLRTTSFRNE
jgi:hypothetical protein